MEFDLDAWTRLARSDPAEFERRRESMLRQVIDDAPPAFRERLEALQRRLDLERSDSAASVASYGRMNTLLWAGLFRLRRELTARPARHRSADAPLQSAKVIPLRGRRRT